MHLESDTTIVNKSQQESFEFLADVNNYEKIMPESIEKFEIKSEESFLFQLKGMPVIGLKIQEKLPYQTVVLGSMSDKFPFTLKADIQEVDANNSKVQLVFDGELNAMMAMMVKSPLKKFINTLSENLGKL
ncbi:SRPBCC family protein [Mesonia aestuariivivens]|uniref:SRPBCC family protein n=1 Tax=Mesonia aestuariivivens TaxID=2796128 RepID=A0ABS6W1L5_9FLAO|nr:SRPBCC family protein [Mesonia aestuariivivens]MBW2961741.1 SRPBCC family protein [Mesonia aestuariivivens]